MGGRPPALVAVSALSPATPEALCEAVRGSGDGMVARAVPVERLALAVATGGYAAGAVAIGSCDPEDPRLAGLWREGVARVLLVGDRDSEVVMLAALRCGAAGYLLTGRSPCEVTSALSRVAVGERAVDPGIASRLACHLATTGDASATPRIAAWDLRPREREVLEALAGGLTNRQIAQQLHLGEETVKTYLRSAYRKIGVRNRSHAIARLHGGT